MDLPARSFVLARPGVAPQLVVDLRTNRKRLRNFLLVINSNLDLAINLVPFLKYLLPNFPHSLI